MASSKLPIIIMADIVGSSDAAKPARLMKVFRHLVDQVNQAMVHRLRSPLTITLGDEFQGIAQDVAAGVELLIALEEAIVRNGRPFTLRYVLHEGRIGTAINAQRAHEMLGPGLTDARAMLGDLKKDRHGRFRIALENEQLNALLNDTLFLYGALVDDRATKDLLLMASFLDHDNYRDVADALGKDASLMWRRRRSLRMEEYFALRRLLLRLASLRLR